MELSYFELDNPDVGLQYPSLIKCIQLTMRQITTQLTANAQAIQLGTSEKVGLFIQSVSYFIAAFTVGFILNAKLTGILFGAVIPAMALVIIAGTTAVSRFSRKASQFTESATSMAEGAINAVMDVQAFGADQALSDEHFHLLSKSVAFGIKKSCAGALMLGGIYFVA